MVKTFKLILYYKYYIVSLSIAISISLAEANFYDLRAEGWHWYEDIYKAPKEDLQKEQPVSISKPEALKKLTPTEELTLLKKELEQALHLAVMYPTQNNVRVYMEKQQQVVKRSEVFAQKWLEVVFMNPHLDSTINNPVNQSARHLYLDQKQEVTERKIQALSKKYGLFFFFKSSCPYCHQFAPIVKRFSEKYGWEVLAISLDGSRLPEFPNARADNGVARNLNVSILPTLLAVSPQDEHVIPLSFGMNSIDHIEERIRVLVKSGEVK